jgi:hypothetical protein
MDRRRVVLALAVALALVTAGCSLPGSNTTTPESDNGTVVDSGVVNESSSESEIDPALLGERWELLSEERIYNRTAAILGLDAPAPEVTLQTFDYEIPAGGKPIFEYLGLRDPDNSVIDGSVLGVASGPDSVRINETFATTNRSERATDASLALVLVHEFAHTIQAAEGWLRPQWSREIPAERGSIERRLLSRSLTEGGAVYTAESYAESLGSERSQVDRYERRYRTGDANETYLLAPYHHGGQYFEAVAEAPESFANVYEEDPPRTTTELLHPERDDFEPTPVSVTTTVRREGWQVEEDSRAGELFVHVTVAAHLGTDRADRAATGYAGDRLVTFDGENRAQYAWVTHWASDTDAVEFADSLDETLGVRSDRFADSVGVRVLGDQTVAVVTGERAVRDDIAFEGTGTAIAVTVSDKSQHPTTTRSLRRAGPLGPVPDVEFEE